MSQNALVYWVPVTPSDVLHTFLYSVIIGFVVLSQGMMIDEADEFVTGPQNKGKRPGESNNMQGGGPKRRRCMSPLLRLGRAYTPPVSPCASPRPTAGESDTATHVRLRMCTLSMAILSFSVNNDYQLLFQTLGTSCMLCRKIQTLAYNI